MKVGVLLLLISITSIGCGQRAAETKPPVDSQAAQDARVSIDNFSYSPAELTIHPGTRVTWTNHDDVPHTVTETAKAFTSGALDTDQTFSRVFDAAGTYNYYCAVHPHMTARIIVK